MDNAIEDLSLQIGQLKADVLNKFGRSVESQKDVEDLREAIFRETKSELSSFTIRRFFGIIEYKNNHRASSLAIFARYVGYMGWSDFCDKIQIDSGFVSENHIYSSDLQLFDVVEFSWMPNRICRVKYLGDSKFEVIYVESAKLEEGDTFYAEDFMQGNPLICTKVMRKNQNLHTYIAGQHNGLSSVRIICNE